MNLRIKIFFCLIIFSFAFCHSQNIDSLIAKSERSSKSKPDSALRYAFLAAELSQKQQDTLRIAKAFKTIGLVYDDIDNADMEVFYYLKAYEFSKNISDHNFKVEVLLNVAESYFDKGNYDEAFSWFKKARSLSNKTTDKDLRYRIFAGIGYIYVEEEFRNLDSAEKYYLISRAIAFEEKDSSHIADSYRNLNEVAAGKRQYERSILYLDTALKIFLTVKDSNGIAQVYKDLGDVYYYIKDNKRSIEYYEKAYEIQKRRGAVSSVSVGAVDLAYMYAMQGRKDLLDKYGEEAYSLALKTKSWERVKYAVQWLGEAYEKTGNDKKALFYFKKLMDVNDSINNRSAITKNSTEEIQGAFEEKMKTLKMEEEKRKAITEEKEHNQKVITNILTVGILITLILLVLAYRSYIAKKKANVIISKQKEEVESQKQKIEEINKEITDSINYAKIIQRSILPEGKEIMKTFPESFGLYKPKSVVSGDVYWFHKNKDTTFIAAVDCTGHGVPGALMSMIAVEKLNEAVAKNIFRPSEILSHLNKGVKATLKQKEDSASKDGMDIALCAFNFQDNILKFAGAMRPLWIIRNKELLEYKPTKTSIGGITSETQDFIEHEIKILKGDSIYIFSDGYADQFGGEKGKKMMTKNMKDLLLSIQNVSMVEQENILNEKLTGWQGNFEQVDDILVIGIRI